MVSIAFQLTPLPIDDDPQKSFLDHLRLESVIKTSRSRFKFAYLLPARALRTHVVNHSFLIHLRLRQWQYHLIVANELARDSEDQRFQLTF